MLIRFDWVAKLLLQRAFLRASKLEAAESTLGYRTFALNFPVHVMRDTSHLVFFFRFNINGYLISRVFLTSDTFNIAVVKHTSHSLIKGAVESSVPLECIFTCTV